MVADGRVSGSGTAGAAELPFVEDASIAPGDATPDGRDAMWAARITLARDPATGRAAVPACMAAVAPCALAAARCLTAARAAGAAPAPTLPPGEVLTYDGGGAFVARVAAAADAASRALLAIVRAPPSRDGLPLAAALDAIATFLLGERADLTSALLDALGEGVGAAPADGVRPASLAAALDTALSSTGLATRPGATSLTLTLDPRSVLGRLRDAREAGAGAGGASGGPSLAAGGAPPAGALRATAARDALALHLSLPFPTCILLPPALTAAAALVWRHSADVACARRALAAARAALAPARALRGRPSPALTALLAHASWMEAALVALEAHTATDVAAPAVRTLTRAFASAPSVDAAVDAADAFTRTLTTGALLSRRVKLARALADVKGAAGRFGRSLAAALADAAAPDAVPSTPLFMPASRRSSVGGLAVDAPMPLGSGAQHDPSSAATARADAAAAQAARLNAGAPDVAAVAGDAAATFRRRLAELAAGAAAAAAAASAVDDGDGRAEADALAKLAGRLGPIVHAACSREGRDGVGVGEMMF